MYSLKIWFYDFLSKKISTEWLDCVKLAICKPLPPKFLKLASADHLSNYKACTLFWQALPPLTWSLRSDVITCSVASIRDSNAYIKSHKIKQEFNM